MEKSRPYHTFLYITVIYLYPSLRPRMRGHYFRAKPVSKNGSVCIIFRMEDKIKIFIGTCVRNLQAEIALEYSLRRNTNSDIEIVTEIIGAPDLLHFDGLSQSSAVSKVKQSTWM
jgi:hypothetical protein